MSAMGLDANSCGRNFNRILLTKSAEAEKNKKTKLSWFSCLCGKAEDDRVSTNMEMEARPTAMQGNFISSKRIEIQAARAPEPVTIHQDSSRPQTTIKNTLNIDTNITPTKSTAAKITAEPESNCSKVSSTPESPSNEIRDEDIEEGAEEKVIIIHPYCVNQEAQTGLVASTNTELGDQSLTLHQLLAQKTNLAAQDNRIMSFYEEQIIWIFENYLIPALKSEEEIRIFKILDDLVFNCVNTQHIIQIPNSHKNITFHYVSWQYIEMIYQLFTVLNFIRPEKLIDEMKSICSQIREIQLNYISEFIKKAHPKINLLTQDINNTMKFIKKFKPIIIKQIFSFIMLNRDTHSHKKILELIVNKIKEISRSIELRQTSPS